LCRCRAPASAKVQRCRRVVQTGGAEVLGACRCRCSRGAVQRCKEVLKC
jgi:hypothetical protein